MNDKKLWTQFSRYIRLRDADSNGMCRCITCSRVAHWKQMHCGHCIPRQYWGVRYNEKNNHSQCPRCNAFEGGRQHEYAIAIDEKYGHGAWDALKIKSRLGKRPSAFEMEAMRKEYKRLADELEALKC